MSFTTHLPKKKNCVKMDAYLDICKCYEILILWYSNARHGGGTVIPYLNFSIPCAALEPVVNFSKGTICLILGSWYGKT